MLERPGDWESDLNEFLARYIPRFHTLIEVLEDCASQKDERRLSVRNSATVSNNEDLVGYWTILGLSRFKAWLYV